LSDPVSEAFRKIIQEIYWVDDLEEAEHILEEYLSMIDADLRTLLLEKRREICSSPRVALELANLESMLQTTEAADDETATKILLAKSMVDVGLLLQCTRSWSKMSPREKAYILAPLYKASYGLELALRSLPERVDERHLDYAVEMAEIALERAEERGLLDELEEHIDNLLGVSGEEEE